jgi:hypothetical protein
MKAAFAPFWEAQGHRKSVRPGVPGPLSCPAAEPFLHGLAIRAESSPRAMMAKPTDGHTPDHGGQHHRLLPGHGGQHHRLLSASPPRRRTTTHSPTMAAKTTAYCRAAAHGSQADGQRPYHGGQDLLPGSRPGQPRRRTATLPNRRLRNPRPSSAMAPTIQEVPRLLTGGSILASTRVG